MAKPYLASEIVLELDFSNYTGANPPRPTPDHIQVECWITGWSLESDEPATETLTTMCNSGSYTLQSTQSAESLILDYAQDWCTPNSLSWLLAKYAGKQGIKFTLIDRGGCSQGVIITGEFSSLPKPQLGGTAGQVATATGVRFPLNGSATIAQAAAATQATGYRLDNAQAGKPGEWTGALGFLTPQTLADLNTGALAAAAPTSGTWAAGMYLLLADKTTQVHYDAAGGAGSRWVVGPAK